MAPAHPQPPSFLRPEPYIVIPACLIGSISYQQPVPIPLQPPIDIKDRRARNRGSRIIASSSAAAPAVQLPKPRQIARPPPFLSALRARKTIYSAGSQNVRPSDRTSSARSQSVPPRLGQTSASPYTRRAQGSKSAPAVAHAAVARPSPSVSSLKPLATETSERQASNPSHSASSKPSTKRETNPALTQIKASPRKVTVKAPPPDMPSQNRNVSETHTLAAIIEGSRRQQKAKAVQEAAAQSLPNLSIGLPVQSLQEGDPVTIVRPGRLSNHLGIVHETRPANLFRTKDTKVFDWTAGGAEWYDSKRELAPASAHDRRRVRPPAEGLPATAQVFDQTNLPPFSVSLV